MEYLIIGNSTAAIGCIEGIRANDKSGTISVVSDEKYYSYGRPLISYYLMGKTDEQRMLYRPESFYEDNGVKLCLGRSAEKISKDKKLVTLDNGEELHYDKLLISTGSKPFVPPFSGLEATENKFSFMKLDDAKSLEAKLTNESRVLIMGAGLIGLKCAEGILDRVASVTVVDLADQILPSILDAKGAEIVKKHLEEKGVTFCLSDTAEKFGKDYATLKSGKKISFDVLVLAVGVRPNTSLVSDAGGKIERGISVNEKNETSLADIYAAGDCCVSYDISGESTKLMAILPNAYMGGYNAGVNMAGGKSDFSNAIPMNSIGFFGLHVITAGSYIGECRDFSDEKTYKKFFIKDNLLKGFIIVGDVSRAGIYTALIRNRTALDSIDFELICEKPQLMAFSSSKRKEFLSKK